MRNCLCVEVEARRWLHCDVLEIKRDTLNVDFMKLLGEYLESHVFEQRNDFRQHNRAAVAEHLEMQNAGLALRTVETQA